MKLVVDENIPRSAADALRRSGHAVVDIRGTPREGSDDDALWALAASEGAILITTDKHFVHKRNEPHQGLLIVRLRQPNRQKIHDRIMRAIAQIDEADWPGTIVVMRDTAQSIIRTERTR